MKYVKPLVFGLALVIAIFVYVQYTMLFGFTPLAYVRLADWYALIAFGFLYLTLLISPLYTVMPDMPGKPYLDRARGALGLSSLFFATLHGSFAFFGLLKGFSGLDFLPHAYRGALALGFAALTILALCAGPTFRFFRERLQGQFKALKIFIYLAGVIILIHATLIGSDFVELGRDVPQIIYLMVFLLLFLETIRIKSWLESKIDNYSYLIWAVLLTALLWAYYYYLFANIHSYHLHA